MTSNAPNRLRNEVITDLKHLASSIKLAMLGYGEKSVSDTMDEFVEIFREGNDLTILSEPKLQEELLKQIADGNYYNLSKLLFRCIDVINKMSAEDEDLPNRDVTWMVDAILVPWTETAPPDDSRDARV